MKNIRVDGRRLWTSIMEMAEIGPLPAGGSRRLALSDEDRAARDLFADWCHDAGCSMKIDRMGNMFARRPGTDNTRPPVAIGSHLDTQPHGGKFDGVFGVLAGLEVVRTLNDNAIQTEAPIEIVNWTNEEGARFAPAMISSGVYAGAFDLEFALSRTDSDGHSIAEELDRIGYVGNEACGAHELGVFLEAHIEQGPILERNDEVIGVVTGGQGQRWFDVTVTGQDAHSGSTPMEGRKDALLVLAQLCQDVETIAFEFKPHGVGTIGEVHVQPNSRNTIPGEVWFSIDLRHPEDQVLSQMKDAFMRAVDRVGTERRMEIKVEEIWHNPPVVFDTGCVNALDAAVKGLGYPHRHMISGAGHDACQIARTVPTAMVFVPCADGISHNEAESAEPEHLEAGANTLLHAAMKLAGI